MPNPDLILARVKTKQIAVLVNSNLRLLSKSIRCVVFTKTSPNLTSYLDLCSCICPLFPWCKPNNMFCSCNYSFWQIIIYQIVSLIHSWFYHLTKKLFFLHFTFKFAEIVLHRKIHQKLSAWTQFQLRQTASPIHNTFPLLNLHASSAFKIYIMWGKWQRTFSTHQTAIESYSYNTD